MPRSPSWKTPEWSCWTCKPCRPASSARRQTAEEVPERVAPAPLLRPGCARMATSARGHPPELHTRGGAGPLDPPELHTRSSVWILRADHGACRNLSCRSRAHNGKILMFAPVICTKESRCPGLGPLSARRMIVETRSGVPLWPQRTGTRQSCTVDGSQGSFVRIRAPKSLDRCFGLAVCPDAPG